MKMKRGMILFCLVVIFSMIYENQCHAMNISPDSIILREDTKIEKILERADISMEQVSYIREVDLSEDEKKAMANAYIESENKRIFVPVDVDLLEIGMCLENTSCNLADPPIEKEYILSASTNRAHTVLGSDLSGVIRWTDNAGMINYLRRVNGYALHDTTISSYSFGVLGSSYKTSVSNYNQKEVMRDDVNYTGFAFVFKMKNSEGATLNMTTAFSDPEVE